MILKINFKILITIAVITLLTSCGNYSFIGNSLPEHLKTINIGLIKDQTGRYDLQLPEKIREKIEEKIEDYRILELNESSQTADSYVEGVVTSYSETIASQKENEVAEERVIQITFTFTFFDNIERKPILKNSIITEKETYSDSQGSSEYDEKIEALIDKICENAVIKLSSNW